MEQRLKRYINSLTGGKTELARRIEQRVEQHAPEYARECKEWGREKVLRMLANNLYIIETKRTARASREQ